jgi:hypothetical protein
VGDDRKVTLPFTPTDEGIAMELGDADIEFLSQIPELLADVGRPAGDPAAARLQVPVYLDDPEASSEWWRLMGDELNHSRSADRSAYGLLLEAAREGTVASRAEAEAFLRVLVEGRLALAARLGVDIASDYDQLDEDDLAALDYLAQLQVLLIAALST